MKFCPPVTVGRRFEIGIAERCLGGAGDDDDRVRNFITFDGVVFIIVSVGLKSGDNRRRYFSTGSFDFLVGDELGVFESSGVFEGVVGPVVGVAYVANDVSWS
jgi:hypothetical protein